MKGDRTRLGLDALWARHHAEWRDQSQVASQWKEAADTDLNLLRHTVRGDFLDILRERSLVLIVTREYEHLVVAIGAGKSRADVSYMTLPHPSGIAVRPDGRSLFVASTRNPNQIFELAPATDFHQRADVQPDLRDAGRLVPVRSTFLPGSLYLHDLAFVGGELHGAAAGINAIVRFSDRGGYDVAWWPPCIEKGGQPRFDRNYIQLNSIAAGSTLRRSYFSASAEAVSARRPGQLNFPVDRRGVVFSGADGSVVIRNLTRPHSARQHDGRLWVNNSGYGELGFGSDGDFVPAVRLPGWTRGLSFHRDIAFVATSRVIPRFRAYAPGLDVDKSVCGVHAVELKSGKIVGSLVWPSGNQIFGVEMMSASVTQGLPFSAAKRPSKRQLHFFYSFRVKKEK